ncbi:kazal-type serine protease inhibitor domain-containing protein 1-like isoform X1 [Hemiscyllium ocellatum]|uniref:kazal-type serine protease inhibitor domain-containing protein 1-like isoform X1 n=1 Tax=Hemiscyllium ocellatum TaxID=170820 RepID=UPI0029672066|nr:kazal-type serine protease inhibitor domain-containing protein 1-like isoform X1 [Hemiscyllium ocellatum]XP_060692712.1 kazal-type serine protease inhibitor domain-containing protein 1-like isoform X1 [Hemiscyllium ocellatum]
MNSVLPAVVILLLAQVVQTLPSLYHRGWLRLLQEGDGCGVCQQDLCPEPHGCAAGTVLDVCDCCLECGNAEGQICDLDNTNHFYGRCGQDLDCLLDISGASFGEILEPQCTCRSQESVCGSDGKTYSNICSFKEVSYRNRESTLSLAHMGPCETVPWITTPPRDVHNITGNDIIFGCEVLAYPMALVEWRKKGNENFLPGDDAHISIQARGGPARYGITGWLQIQGLKKSDEGIYTCYTRNKYGEAFASAHLSVYDPDSPIAMKMSLKRQDRNYIGGEEEDENDDYNISGDDEY